MRIFALIAVLFSVSFSAPIYLEFEGTIQTIGQWYDWRKGGDKVGTGYTDIGVAEPGSVIREYSGGTHYNVAYETQVSMSFLVDPEIAGTRVQGEYTPGGLNEVPVLTNDLYFAECLSAVAHTSNGDVNLFFSDEEMLEIMGTTSTDWLGPENNYFNVGMDAIFTGNMFNFVYLNLSYPTSQYIVGGIEEWEVGMVCDFYMPAGDMYGVYPNGAYSDISGQVSLSSILYEDNNQHTSNVPEPATISLLFAGLCMLPLLRLRKKKSI